MTTNNPYAPPTALVADVPPPELASASAPFFAVSVTKLIVMSIFTLGIYEVYCLYRNWKLIKARDQSDIYPVARAIFAIFYVYQCFARIRDYQAPGLVLPRLAAGPLALGWAVTTLMYRLPDPYG